MDISFTIEEVLDLLKGRDELRIFPKNAKLEINHDIRDSKFEITATKELPLELIHAVIKKELKRRGKPLVGVISYENGIFTCT